MSMFDFSEVNNIQEAGNTSKKLKANAIHKVVISSLVSEQMATVNGPSNVLKITFTGIEGDSEGATYEHILFEPKPEDKQGKVFDDGSIGVSPLQNRLAFVRQFLTAVSPAYAEYIKGGAVERYASWIEWRAAIVKFATPAMNSKKPFEIKLFGTISESNGNRYVNASLPSFFLGKKRTGELFSKCTLFGHNLSFSQKWEKDQLAKTEAAEQAVPSAMPDLTSNAAAEVLSSIAL